MNFLYFLSYVIKSAQFSCRALHLRSTTSLSLRIEFGVTIAIWDWSRPKVTAIKVCSDSTRNEQVKTSVCHINFDGSSANARLFSSR